MDAYVIHCQVHKERLVNIEHHLKLVVPSLKIWNGTMVTSHIEGNKLLKNHNITTTCDNAFKTPGEIGCYLSHFLIIQQANNTGYTLVLEDDTMLKDKFLEFLNSNISVINDDFDIFYLGLNCINKGTNVVLNIHDVNHDEPLHGTHSYVINNKHASKIYNALLHATGPIDEHFKTMIKSNILKAYVMFPYLCQQDRTSFYSTIKESTVYARGKNKNSYKVSNNSSGIRNDSRIKMLTRKPETKVERTRTHEDINILKNSTRGKKSPYVRSKQQH